MDKKRFIWLLKNSVKITTEEYPHSIYYYMDKNIERQIKLHKVLDINEPIKFDLNNIDNKNLLFELDTKNKTLWVDSDKVWEKLESNNDYKDLNIRTLVDEWLKDDTIWKVYTPSAIKTAYFKLLKDDNNWKVYTPSPTLTIPGSMLGDANWKAYTPRPLIKPYQIVLKDNNN